MYQRVNSNRLRHRIAAGMTETEFSCPARAGCFIIFHQGQGWKVWVPWDSFDTVLLFIILMITPLAFHEIKMRKLVAIIILSVINVLLISGCSGSNDKNDYEDTIATMSMEKAKRFFDNYPESQYRDKLANEIIGWCKQEETGQCYEMIINALPKNHPRHKEIVAYYKEHFIDKK